MKTVTKCWLKTVCTRKVQGVSIKISKAISPNARREGSISAPVMLSWQHWQGPSHRAFESVTIRKSGTSLLSGAAGSHFCSSWDLGISHSSLLYGHSCSFVPLSISAQFAFSHRGLLLRFIVMHAQYRKIKKLK